MPRTAPSADGTPIAHEIVGDGPPLVLVAGIFCTRDTLRPLADALADRFRVAVYDRRGRGASGGAGPVPDDAVAREVEDLDAVIGALGGEASVYGHSSGAGVALQAAAAGLAIPRLVLHEPPYGPDDEQSTRAARILAEEVGAALADDRPGEAVSLFLADSGMPAEAVDAISTDPRMRALASTMPHDFAVMGDDTRGGTIPEDMIATITVPTLVLSGGASDGFFRDTAARLAGILQDGAQMVLEGADHAAPADAVAPVVANFVTATAADETDC
jgi:pimeloyl-ACP methyl ester carboxylesterase